LADAVVLFQFLISRASTPKPFRPKHMRNFSEAELEALEKLNLNGSPSAADKNHSPLTPSKLGGSGAGVAASREPKVDLELLEKKAEEGINGHS
jgi:hypothetical protein